MEEVFIFKGRKCPGIGTYRSLGRCQGGKPGHSSWVMGERPPEAGRAHAQHTALLEFTLLQSTRQGELTGN